MQSGGLLPGQGMSRKGEGTLLMDPWVPPGAWAAEEKAAQGPRPRVSSVKHLAMVWHQGVTPRNEKTAPKADAEGDRPDAGGEWRSPQGQALSGDLQAR